MKKETNPALRIAAIVLACAVLALAIYTVTRYLRFRAGQPAEPDPPVSTAEVPAHITAQTRGALEDSGTVVWKGTRYVPRKGIEAYLIMGVDRSEAQIASGVVNGQADVLLLLVLDVPNRSYRILQFNRDTVTQVHILNGDGSISATLFKPICLAHAYGKSPVAGCENTVTSVEFLLGDVPISGYAAVSLESVGTLNDAVGGVTVTIDRDLTGADPAFTEGATVRLNAKTAERFVRARMDVGDDDNLNRMGRQMQYMRAWLETARTKSQEDAQFALRLLQRLEPVMTTDMTEKRLSGLAADAAAYENGGFVTIDGEYRMTDGFNLYYPDGDSLMDTVLALFYEEAQP